MIPTALIMFFYEYPKNWKDRKLIFGVRNREEFKNLNNAKRVDDITGSSRKQAGIILLISLIIMGLMCLIPDFTTRMVVWTFFIMIDIFLLLIPFIRGNSEMKSLKKQLEEKQDEIDSLNEEIDKLQAEKDTLRHQMLEEKERRLSSETKLSELGKLSAGVAKNSSQDDMIKAMRTYINISKRKAQSKRDAAKMVFMEMLASAKLELPNDIMDSLEHLDDDQGEQKVVNVTGNYNDVHDNGNVDLKE